VLDLATFRCRSSTRRPPAAPGRAPYENEVVKRWTAAIAASGRVCVRQSGIQLRPFCGIEERDRLGVSEWMPRRLPSSAMQCPGDVASSS